LQLASHVPLHDAAQVPLHEASHVPLHDPSQEPLQLASQVGQPGQVHWVQQVHCSPNTVPFAFCTAVVSKLSIRRSSSRSLSFM
jgi:hypothetical protein